MNSRSLFSQVDPSLLAVEKLADGSTAIVDERTKTVHSLNPTAALVFEACAQGVSLEQIIAALELHAGHAVAPEVALEAISQLGAANLIASDAPMPLAAIEQDRRSVLKAIGTFGAVALPVVLTLTAAEQKAYAQGAGSRTTTRPPN